MEEQYQTISKFDRQIAGLVGGNNLQTKAATIENINYVKGEAETFIIQTIRAEERKRVIKGLEEIEVVTSGDYIVIKYLDKDGPMRLILPPKVSATIARQAAALSDRARSNHSKAAMRERMANGYVPKPPKRKKAVA